MIGLSLLQISIAGNKQGLITCQTHPLTDLSTLAGTAMSKFYRHFLITFLASLSMAFSMTAFSAEDNVQQALRMLKQLQSDPELKQQAYEQGEERVTFCSFCHGKDGNSKRDDIPNLAAQNPQYLFTAFEKFATGERHDYVMSKLAKTLSLEERINIALYYGMQKVHVKESENPELAEKGKTKFLQCVACHGQDGTGAFDKPRLAGQRSSYIIHSLNLFRNKDPSRAGSEMTPIASTLSESDIEALAHYLQGLNP